MRTVIFYTLLILTFAVWIVLLKLPDTMVILLVIIGCTIYLGKTLRARS